MTRFAVVLAVMLSTSVASADRQSALKYFRSEEKAYRAQNFAAAAQSFYQAFQELPLPEIAFSAAQSYRRQFRVDKKREYVERAVEMYRFYLDKVKSGGRVGDAADSLGEMELELAKLGGARKEAPVVELTQLGVTVDLVGVSAATSMKEIDETRSAAPAIPVIATLDGKPVEPDKLIDVEPGDHVFHVEAEGFAPADKKGHAVKGRGDFVEIELQPLPAHVAITTERGARVSVDGRGIGTAPFAAVSLAAGRHVVTIVQRGREPMSREILVGQGETLAIDQPLVPTRQRRAVKWVALGAGVLGVITVTTGIAAVVEDSSAEAKLERLRMGSQEASVLADYRRARDTRDQLVNGTWIAGGAALAVGAIAVIMFYADTPSAEGVRVTPFASANAGGASVIGRF
ncbi:MAG: PEGA domain-containing protein [Polyangiales bacterium]